MSKRPPSVSTVKHFAKVSRQVVLRKMAPDNAFDARVYWALILWSWCGPDQNDAVVKKDGSGFIIRDTQGKPIPARQRDIFYLLELPKEVRGHLSRAISRLVENDLVWIDEAGVMYPNPEPPAFDQKSDTNTGIKFQIADSVFTDGNLPEGDTRTASIRWLEETSTAWKKDLKELRTRYRKILVQAVFEGLIIIEKSTREKREASYSQPPIPAPDPEKANQPAEPPPIEERAQENLVPDDQHKNAVRYLFSEIGRMQRAYPNSAFAQTAVDPENVQHRNLIELILKKLGRDDDVCLLGFVTWVAAQFKGIGKRPPGSPNGPQSLGLLVKWAEDYARQSTPKSVAV